MAIHTPYRRPQVDKTRPRMQISIRPQLVVGLALLALGIPAFFFGARTASVTSASNAISGWFEWPQAMFILGGGLAGLAGLLLALVSLLKKHA